MKTPIATGLAQEEWVSISQVARMMGMTRKNVRLLGDHGKFKMRGTPSHRQVELWSAVAYWQRYLHERDPIPAFNPLT